MNSIKFIILVLLLMLVQLVLFIYIFPDFFKKVIIGSCILFVKIFIRSEEKDIRNDLQNDWSILFIIYLITCITIPFVIIITTLCVILKNCKCALYLFYACVTTCIVFEIAIFIYVHNKLNDGPRNIVIDDWLHASVRDYNKPGCGYLKIIWDYLQPMFKCCGYDSPEDWTHPDKFNVREYGYNYVPESCCITSYPCGIGSYANQTSYWVGCAQKTKHITVVAETIVWVFGGLAITKVIAVLLAKSVSSHHEKISLILPTTLATTRVNTVDNKKELFKKRQNSFNLPADVIRGSVFK